MAKTAKELLTDAKLDKTYWGKKIIAAEKRGWFTESDKDKAANWQTCACGKQDPRIPRRSGGSPTDSWLSSWGVSFFSATIGDSPLAAADALLRIERRACKVLAEVLDREAAVAESDK